MGVSSASKDTNLASVLADLPASHPANVLAEFGFQTALFNRLKGVQRIYIELHGDDKAAEVAASRYVNLVQDLAQSVSNEPTFDKSNPEQFVKLCWECFVEKYEGKFGDEQLISEAVNKNKWDCDNSSYLFSDVAYALNVNNIEIVAVPGHAFMKVGEQLFETTSGDLCSSEYIALRYPEIEYDYHTAIKTFASTIIETCKRLKDDPETLPVAAQLIEKALLLDPHNPDSYLVGANIADDLKDLNGKRFLLERGDIHCPESIAIAIRLGQMHEDAGDYSAAFTTYNAAKALHPQSSFLLLARMRTRAALGDFTGAAFELAEFAKFDQNLQYLTTDAEYDSVSLKSYQKSLQKCSEFIKSNPDDSNAYVMRAIFSHCLLNTGGVSADFDTALSKNPQNAYVYLFRGVFRQVDACNLTEAHDAIEDLSHAIDLDPKLTSAYMHLGNIKQLLKNYDGAAEDYQKALTIDFKNPQAYLRLAWLYVELGKLDEASVLYKIVLAEDPRNYLAHERLGDIYNKQDDFESARNSFKRSLVARNFKADKSLYEKLGETESKLNNWQNAISYYSDAIDYCLQYYSNVCLGPHKERGLAYAKIGNYEAAIDDLSIHINKDWGQLSVDSYCTRGLAFWKLKKNDEALADYLRASELSPDDLRPLSMIPQIYALKGEISKAILEQTKLIELNPKPQCYYRRAGYHEALGETDKAISDLRIALSLSPNDFKTELQLAKNLIAQGEINEANAIVTHRLDLEDESLINYTQHLENLAKTAHEQKNLLVEVSALDKLLELDSTNHKLLFQRGLCHLKGLRFGKSVRDFKLAIVQTVQ